MSIDPELHRALEEDSKTHVDVQKQTFIMNVIATGIARNLIID